MPKVSVVIPVYKAEEYIERCARTLLQQTLDDIEYIFVNDCTPDCSMQVLESVLRDYPDRVNQVKVINHLVNTGQSGARRDGMSVATGDYIIHCDADDWVDLDMYETMYRKALETNADSVSCDIVLEYDKYKKVLCYNNLCDDHRLMYDCIAPISVEYCSMCNRLVSSKVLKKHTILPYDGVNMWDDVGISIRVRYYCHNNIVINRAFYHYNMQNETSTTRRSVCDRIEEQVRCANHLENFFRIEGEYKKYHRFINLIKLVSKHDLFFVDISRWRKIFPESQKYIYLLKPQWGFKGILKFYMYAYCHRVTNAVVAVRNRNRR